MVNRMPTLRVNLPGGQNRLRQLIIYVAKRCNDAERFGAIKLNKILWRADFQSFAQRALPITGREYKRLELGPAPKEIYTLHPEMQAQGLIRLEKITINDDYIEHRTIALGEPDTTIFSKEDLAFVDESVQYYWAKTGMVASEDSHGIAWKSRNNGDLMPYELALLSDRTVGKRQFAKLRTFIEEEGLSSL
jgi:hypothetical protein